MTVTRYSCAVVSGDGTETETVQVVGGVPVLISLASMSRSPIEIGCRGGGCGVCRVQVLDGNYETKRMSRRFVSEAEEAAGYALACRLIPGSNLTLRLDPLQH